MVSGDPATVERIRPMISLWGRTLTVAGDTPGAAQVLKLPNNILSAVALAATAEAFVMGRQGRAGPRGDGGGDQRRQRDATAPPIEISRLGADPQLRLRAEMHILMKDIDLAIAQGEALGVPMWVCQPLGWYSSTPVPGRGEAGT